MFAHQRRRRSAATRRRHPDRQQHRGADRRAPVRPLGRAGVRRQGLAARRPDGPQPRLRHQSRRSACFIALVGRASARTSPRAAATAPRSSRSPRSASQRHLDAEQDLHLPRRRARRRLGRPGASRRFRDREAARVRRRLADRPGRLERCRATGPGLGRRLGLHRRRQASIRRGPAQHGQAGVYAFVDGPTSKR